MTQPVIADLWSAAGAALQSQAPAIEPIPRDQSLPLSFAQERLWGLSREEGASSYNVPWAWQVTGPLNAALLEQSLRSVVRRHEILRTRFEVSGTGPVAVVDREDLQLRLVDLEGSPDALRKVLRLAAQEARRPFDLERGPLFRAALFRLAAQQHLFLITVHQIVFDGGSLRPLVHELGLAYQSLARGKSLAIAPAPIQYADFAAWQRHLVQSPRWEADRAYWRQQLQNPYRPLPLGNSGCAENSGVVRKQFWSASPGLFARIKRLAVQENATPFTIFLAVLQALWFRYTGSTDVITFTSASARVRPDLHPMIGLLANILPMRGDLSGEPTFRELLDRLRALELGNFAHQSFPFEKILELLPVQGGPAPLFQTLLLYRHAPQPDPAIDGLTFRALEHEIETGPSPFSLFFDIAESNGGLRGVFKYRPERLDAATASTFLQNFHRLLREAIAHPDRPLRELPLQLPPPPKPAAALPASDAPVAPANSLEEHLAGIWEKLFGRNAGTRDNFFDLGGHSLMAVRMFAELAPIIGRRLPPSVLFEAPTIEQLARLIRTRAPALRSLVAIQPRGSKPPVYCISGAGGSVFLFNQLSRHLGDDQPIYGLEPLEPGGEQAVPLFLEEIAAHYVREIRAAQPQGPYHLIGFSFGGMVAFEIAQQLLALQQEVGLLALFDSEQTASSRTWPAFTRLRSRVRNYCFRLRPLIFGPNRSLAARALCKAKGLKLLFRLHGMFGRQTLPPALAAAASAEDRHVFARDRYQPKPFPGRVTLFRAQIRPEFEAYDYYLGWKELAQGGVEVHEVPGDHHTMSQEPNVAVLAEEFRRSLQSARTWPSGTGIRRTCISSEFKT